MSPAAAVKTAVKTAPKVTYSTVLQRLIDKYTDGTVVEIPVNSMFEDYNVRMAPIHEDRIAHFEALYTETPDEVPPVFVEAVGGGRHRDLDGRTRHASADNLGLKTIRARVFKGVSENDRTLIATLANLGGPRHMDGDDIKLACDRHLEAGMKAPEIRAMYAGAIPKEILYKALHHSQTDALKKMYKRARKLIEGGDMTLKEAAAKVGMTTDQVKSFKRSIRGKGDKEVRTGRAVGMLGQKFKLWRSSLVQTSAHWLKQHQEGDLDSDQANELYNAWEGFAKDLLSIAVTARQKFKNQAQGE